jgi:hypothetical protein
MKRDTVLKNDTLRELYLIKGLGEFYYYKETVKYSVLQMLEYISQNGLTADNKLIAKNSLMRLDKLRVGTPAPPFTLKNIVTGQPVSLADFKGKVVYLSFWDEDNVAAVQEIDFNLPRSGEVNQIAEVAAAMGARDWAFAPSVA